jgi:hypothetical protein
MAQHAMQRIRAEYLEMPGLHLTFLQVQRLCGVEPHVCRAALDTLVEERFLCMKPNGAYARVSDGQPASRPQTAKADLRAYSRAQRAAS